MADPLQRCPGCGETGPGQFCSHCGHQMASAPPAACPGCGITPSSDARYCHRCGASFGPAGGAAKTHRPLWIVASLVVLALVVVIGVKAVGGFSFTTPDMANVGNQNAPGASAPAPDISQMSPRERFDRLYSRIMAAGAGQDSATVVNFTPMALGAYSQLDSFDDGARYRAALIRIQTGDFVGAQALADTILAQTPAHLLGLVIRGSVANFVGDEEALGVVYQDFLSNYDEELNSGRPEYISEQGMIDSFRQAALAASTATD
jgi:hypothetical protein